MLLFKYPEKPTFELVVEIENVHALRQVKLGLLCLP